MKILIIWLASFALAGIIISPFFWLRFLKQKSVGKYLWVSSVATLIVFSLYVTYGYNFINDWAAKKSADLYYFLYDITDFPIYIVLLLILISPFIFSKIIYGKMSWRRFFISVTISAVIFLTYAYVFAYILLPWAFAGLMDHF